MDVGRALFALLIGALHVAACSFLGLLLIMGSFFAGPDMLHEIWRYPVASILFAAGSALVAVLASRVAARGSNGGAFFAGAGGQAAVNFVAFAAYQTESARAQPVTEGMVSVPAIVDPLTLALVGFLGLLYAGVAPLMLARVLTSSDG